MKKPNERGSKHGTGNGSGPRTPEAGRDHGLSNHRRVQTAEFALRSACWARGDSLECDEKAVTDLLTDLRHLCRANAIDYEACERIAACHFEAEGGAS